MSRFISALLLSVNVFVVCQATDYEAVEDTLLNMFRDLYRQDQDEVKKSMNRDIIDYFSRILEEGASFDYAFDSLDMIGRLTAPDKSFRIITWNIPLEGFAHEYHGLIQLSERSSADCRVFRLNNGTPLRKQILKESFSHEEWPGALYYEVHRNKSAGTVFYTLMGFNFKDRFSDMKVLETLYFDESGEPVFGMPVFKNEEEVLNRVLFEYSGEVVFNLRFNPDMKMIIFDHLAPIEPELAGHPRFYAPDFSYDGFRFRRGHWVYQAELDVRNR